LSAAENRQRPSKNERQQQRTAHHVSAGC
jgi:hypothetical protein